VPRSSMVVYGSDQAHAIIEKACMVLGLKHHVIPTAEPHNWTLQATDLAAAIKADLASGLLPIAAVATTGTTSTCTFDSLPPIAEVCKQQRIWLHVDAAYGGAYACLPQMRSKFEGLEQCDSFVVNCHKKLLCPFDLAALYVADRKPILDALSLQPEYLRNEFSESGAVVDFEHWQMPLGRRFRALKLWFVLRRFGVEGIRAHVAQGMKLASLFASYIEGSDLFELATPVSLSLVCFRLKVESEDTEKQELAQQRLLEAVKATGECFVIHTKLKGRHIIRFACGGIEQSEDDVKSAWSVIEREGRRINAESLV